MANIPPENTTPPKLHAALDAAFEFLRPAYEVALRRADVAEARARANLTFAGTFMFAAPAFVTATMGVGARSFSSPWFIIGAAAFAGVIGCLVAQQIPRIVGHIQVVSLEIITQENYLDATPEEFKLNLLLHGADAQATNSLYVAKMGNCASVGAVLFGIQVAVLAVWALHG